MTFTSRPAAAVAAAVRRPPVRRINALPIALLALAGTAALAIFNFAFAGSAESALTKRLNELAAQVSALEKAVEAHSAMFVGQLAQKTSRADAVSKLEVQQVQIETLVTKLAKDVEALRGIMATVPAATVKRAKR